ncbi:leucine-rich repeat domain-containing protein [Micromonospora inositola]|uniref:Leucine-rich repeat domain-containing protein n=1 Tax=Micromonospora inositola TaxID=47865 RepID=A0A1C5J4U1_9ACTN|nr:hypothetical protein [Micromonospora inositola]SCG65600.1 hypothetical protein GA0070613_4027 [Micromonospora inositola]
MKGLVEVSSSVDVRRLGVGLRDDAVVQFCRPLAEPDYGALAAFLTDHPTVTLRVYGSDEDLAALRFLRWFPRLRRLSVAGLYHLADLAPLQQLSPDVEAFDLGESRKLLDLTPVAAFRGLRRLRVVAHRRGLADLLAANPGLQGLALWRLPVDRVVPDVVLPRLQSLALTLGSLTAAEWLTRISTLRCLALRTVRKLTDLAVVARLPALQWLWLDALPVDRLPDLSSCAALLRVDCTAMRHLRHPAAVRGLAAAPRLQDLTITESLLPVEAFTPFVDHPTLEHIGVGLGSERRNREAGRLLARTPPRSDTAFAAAHGLLRML